MPEPKSDEEAQKLYEKAQEAHRRAMNRWKMSQIQDLKHEGDLAQCEHMISLLKDAPSLADYKPGMWRNYHTANLEIAAKARQSHKKEMEQMKKSKFRRWLDTV